LVVSNDDLAGQRMMVGFEGTEPNDRLKQIVENLKVAGIILFSCNIQSPDQLRDLCAYAQGCARRAGLPPLFIAVDQEGGSVARLREPWTRFPDASQMNNETAIADFTATTAAELTDAGINMNMAPVLDIAPAGIQSVMADRSFGPDPDRVAELGAAVIKGFQQRHLMAVAKHFPGIGRTELDSHLDLPVLDIDLPSLRRSDLIPFHAAVRQGVAGMMLSHIFYRRIDPDWPASLSTVISKDLLREEMGYRGLVLTDDLDMGAIEKHYGIRTVVDRILQADIDLALICHEGPNIEAAHQYFCRQITDSAEFRRRSEISIQRIQAAKKRFGLTDV
jgi:beta-N-acetylhexosaminidase